MEIHHIEPEGEGGPSTDENACPLCPTCHDILGGNKDKRKLLRQQRDQWYEICAERERNLKDGGHVLGDIHKMVTDLTEHARKNSASADEVLEENAEQRAKPQPIGDTAHAWSQEQIDTLGKCYLNEMLNRHFTGSKYMEWLRKLDGDDARWVYLGAEHDLTMLYTLKRMQELGIEVIESEEREVTQRAAKIDIEMLVDVWRHFADIVGAPDDVRSDMEMKIPEILKIQWPEET